jgi:hypothetical protein
VSQRFALHMRVWTILFAVVLAFGIKLDSFDLLHRLSTDAKLRASLASSYAAISQTAAQVSAASAQAKPVDAKRAMEDLAKLGQTVRTQLDDAGFRLIPKEYAEWSIWPGWGFGNPHFWGFLFSAAMLSLGAPFWFNALKSLANLRPLLANKQDKELKASPAAA